MQEIDPKRLFDSFLQAAQVYRKEPGLSTGLELDEKAASVRQACYTHLKDAVLGRLFEQLLSDIRKQDTALVLGRLGEIDERLAGHGIQAN